MNNVAFYPDSLTLHAYVLMGAPFVCALRYDIMARHHKFKCQIKLHVEGECRIYLSFVNDYISFGMRGYMQQVFEEFVCKTRHAPIYKK